MNSQLLVKLRETNVDGISYNSLVEWKGMLEETVNSLLVEHHVQLDAQRNCKTHDDYVCLGGRIEERKWKIDRLYDQIAYIRNHMEKHEEKVKELIKSQEGS